MCCTSGCWRQGAGHCCHSRGRRCPPCCWKCVPAAISASRTGLWASTLCCAALSVQGASVLLQVRTICPAGDLAAAIAGSAGGASAAVDWRCSGWAAPGTEQAVQTFSTLSERVVVHAPRAAGLRPAGLCRVLHCRGRAAEEVQRTVRSAP
ncbi:MAG: hypothetical protein ACLUSW_04610 [Faecalibacterium sp.]